MRPDRSGKPGPTSRRRSIRLFGVAVMIVALVVCARSGWLQAAPVEFTDSAGVRIQLEDTPRRVVSLVPAMTELLFRIGAGDRVVGVTWHDTWPPEASEKAVAGGFLHPSPALVAALEPDLVVVSSLNAAPLRGVGGPACRLALMEPRSIAEFLDQARLLGAVFEREAAARELVSEIEDDLGLLRRKVERIPAPSRKRVMRIMGPGPDGDSITVPGDDSFQNEVIRAAGGIPPTLGRNGAVALMTREEWLAFDPQVVYGCGGAIEAMKDFFAQPGWNGAAAARNGGMFDFPCELTCRLSPNVAKFAAWLASSIYEEDFADPGNRVEAEKATRSRPLELPFDYVRKAEVRESRLFDFRNKTLLVEFKAPMRVTSTLEGERRGILTAGNHYSPPPCWGPTHRLGFEACRARIHKALGTSPEKACLLFTGADMGNLSVRTVRFGKLTVTALVTAGVLGNALRASVDEGRYEEPGTINIMLMTNRRLTPRAMARAILTATEAKTAALQDLDVRSTPNPRFLQATGTGTDEVTVVEGRGAKAENAGGHGRLGQLIAKAVYDGVREAVYRQNGVKTPRNVFRRLMERKISPFGLFAECPRCPGGADAARRCGEAIEEVLLDPRHAAFVESALALGDARERGQVGDLAAFRDWCRLEAREIAGGEVPRWTDRLSKEEGMPEVVGMALDALLNGLAARKDAPCVDLGDPPGAARVLAAVEGPAEGLPIPPDPGRIVSLAPSMTEIVFALGRGDRLVGVTEMCDTPAEAGALPKIGAFMRPDLERLVALRPDLCIGIRSSTPEDLTRRLAGFGIPVAVLDPRDLDGVVDGVRRVGKWVGAETRANSLADAMRARIDAVRSRTGGTIERPGVFFQVGVTPIVSVGSRTFIDELIALAGGVNLAAGPIPYPRFSREQVLAMRPEILIVTSMTRGVSFEEVAREWRTWTDLPAVRAGRVHVVDSDLFDRPSMRLVDALEILSGLIHPESWTQP